MMASYSMAGKRTALQRPQAYLGACKPVRTLPRVTKLARKAFWAHWTDGNPRPQLDEQESVFVPHRHS